jgi:hypothetical protein
MLDTLSYEAWSELERGTEFEVFVKSLSDAVQPGCGRKHTRPLLRRGSLWYPALNR